MTDAGLQVHIGARAVAPARTLLLLRPESVDLGLVKGAGRNTWEGTVTAVQYRGPTVEFGVDLGTGEHLRVLKTLPGHQDLRVGQRVWVGWDEDQGVALASDEAVP